MAKSKYYYQYCVVVKYRNWSCHLFTMQVPRHDKVQMVLSVSGGCTISELVMPSVYHAGFHA
jgi:hypothetical protein